MTKAKPLRILVTAGPTREPIDPVRFISNFSTGTMGYSIAGEAKERNHKVTLISGPTSLRPPKGVAAISVTTAREMKREVRRRFPHCDCLIMASAVSDFRVGKYSQQKIKTTKKKHLTLKLVRNPDIIAGVARRKGKRLVVGFALESGPLLKNAAKKLREKNLDLIVANRITKSSSPFGTGPTSAVIISKNGSINRIAKVSKKKLAKILLDKVEKMKAA